MQIGSLVVARTLQSKADWAEQRERRARQSRRAEDRAAEPSGPSLTFLTQVVSQTSPEPSNPLAGYGAPHRWRCGVCADERA